MIDPGTPVSRGTDWLSLDVPQIWAMIADHETEAHQRVVSGWRKTAELSQLHLHRLQAYRRELAATWSPTGSAAAREYLDRLDLLIATIRKTHDTASTNYTTFAAATSAVTQSRRDLQQIYDDYTAKVQIRLDYDRLMQERKAMGGGEIVNSAPPVSDQELQQLRGRARLVMYGLSSELNQAETQLQMPPRYKNDRNRDPEGEEFSNAAALPPIAGGFAAAGAALPHPPGSVATTPPNSTSGTGPVLGSAGPLAPAPPLTPVTPPTAAPPGGGTGLPPVSAPDSGIPIGRPPRRPSPENSVIDRPVTGRTPPGVSGSSRGIPPSGIIGGSAAASGAPGASGRANRINPVGGVIGGTGAPTGRSATLGPRPAGQTGLGYPPATGAPSRRRQDDEEARLWNPDHPWETKEGVEPVLLPPRPPGRIDPGPAIGYVR